MYTFGRYATFANTYDLVSYRHFFNWVSNSERNVESLIMILSYSSLSYFSPPLVVALYEVLLQIPAITMLEHVAVQCNHPFSPSKNYLQLVIARLVYNA